jgi:hypothetical protein
LGEVGVERFKVEVSLGGICVMALGAVFGEKHRGCRQLQSEGAENEGNNVAAGNPHTTRSAKHRSYHAGFRITG